MSRGPAQAQNSKHTEFPISQHAAPSFCPARCPLGPATDVHPEVNLGLRSVTLSGTISGSTFPLTPASGVSSSSTRLASVASDPTATPFSSSKSSGASISTSGHALNQSTTATGGDPTSHLSTTTDPPILSVSSTSSFEFTTGSSSTSVSLPPLPSIMSTSKTSSTPRPSSSTPFIPFTSLNTTSIPISTSTSTSRTSTSTSTSTSATATTTDPPSLSGSPAPFMSSTPTTTPTSLDPTPILSSITSLSTTDPEPSATAAGAAPDTSTTTTNSHQHTSTITATRVYTFTLPGGQTTVVSTVEESRVLSTSDPVAGSRFSHNTGAIIGVAVSATVGVILSVFVVFLSCTRYQRRYRRQQRHQLQGEKGFHLGGRSWNALRGNLGRADLPPIPEGPIPTRISARGRERMDSSANILGRAVDGEYGEDKVWRPPLVEDDDGDAGEEVEGLGDVVRGASPTGRGGYGLGSGCCDGTAGVVVGGTEVKSSLGHSQSWGHASSGHGLGLEHADVHLVTDSGAGIPAQAPYPYPVYAYLPVVGGYPGPGPAYVPPGGGLGAGVAAEVAPVTYVGMMGEITYAAPGDVVSSDNGHRSGEAVKGAGGFVSPRTSEGEDLGRSSDGTICEVAGAAGLERGSGSGSSRSSRGTTTVRVDSTSTSSRSRKSLKEVLKRFRPSSKEISPSSPSGGGGGGTTLAGPMLGGAAGAGGTTTHGGAETRPVYDYGAIVRPHQRQMVLERAFGHHHHQPHLDGAGLVPPPPAILVNHAQVLHFPLFDAYPPPELAHAHAPGPPPTVLTTGPAYDLEHVDASPCPRLSADEIDNEEDSLDPRGSVVRDKLLDPFFLSPAAGGSSPNIEGASLRDYVDYSRRIGGMVKNRVISTTTFDTVDHDQDGASSSVSVGTLS